MSGIHNPQLNGRKLTTVPIAMILRWLARIGSVVSIALLLMFLFGGAEDLPKMNKESIGLIFFPLGIVIGMVLGWRYEMLGGALAISSLFGFYAWHRIVSGDFPGGPYFVIFTSPGILFLAAGAVRHLRQES